MVIATKYPWRQQTQTTEAKYPWRTADVTPTPTAKPPTPTDTPGFLGIPYGMPLGGTVGMEASIEVGQRLQAEKEQIAAAIPLKDEAGQPITYSLFPTDVGLDETVLRSLFKVKYEGEEIIDWEPLVKGVEPTQLTFSADPTTGDTFILSQGKVIGQANAETGELTLDDEFIFDVQNMYMSKYAGALPVTWPGGQQVPLSYAARNKLEEFLLRKSYGVSGTIRPSIAEELGTIGFIGSLLIMAPQAIAAAKQVVSSATRGVLDLFIKNNARDIALLVQRGEAGQFTRKDQLLYKLYNYHRHYIARRAQEIIIQQRAPVTTQPSQVLLLESNIKTATQTTDKIVQVVKTGKELTTTSITGLIATGTPIEFVSGITSAVGIVMPVAVQQEFMVRASTWLQQVPQVIPNTLHTVGIPEGEAFIRTDSQGNPLVAGISQMREGQLTLSTIVAQPGKELAVAKALIDVGEYLKANNIAFPPRAEMSPDAVRVYDKLVARGEVPEFAPTTAVAEWETVSGVPEVTKPVEVTAPADVKKLRQSIMATVKTKGLSESKYRTLFKKEGGTRNLTEMGADKLNEVLRAVREARPVKVKGKNVITAKTENAIQTLKDVLVAEKKLTPEIYESLKKDLGLETDKYESRELFITERQARSLIREMNVEAEVELTKWDVAVSEGLANKPELRTSIDNLTKRIITENKPKPKKDVAIPFKKTATEISEYPDDVKLSGTLSMLRALRRFQEQLGGREVTRIYETAEMMIEQRRLNEITLANTVNAMKLQAPQLATIIKDKDAMDRIQRWLDADLKIVDVKKPDLAPAELEVAQLFRARYDQWKNIVRLERFKDAYFHYGGRAKEVVAELIKHGTEGTSDVAIPDAPLKDIKEAITIYEARGETALQEYLNTKDWGVLKSGYSFSQILHPKLRMYKGTSVRAATTSLHQRKGLEFLRDEKTPWERLIAYERQMIGLTLQPYYRKMDTEFRRGVESGRISPESASSAANKISLFMREVKGYPIESPAVSILLRIGGWSFGTLAKVPWMSVRNLHQNIAFHPDKSEIIKSFFGRGFFSNPLTKRGRLDYTDALVHQYKGVQQEQILMGYMGKTPLENLIRKTDYYHLSDKANRYMSMQGSGAKAERALKQYLKDKDAEKFLKNSGANELSATEQVRILEYLALETYEYGGVLNAVSGGEAAIRDIAGKITTLNHFNYVRYLRSSIEMGEVGRVLGSLVAFPRSVIERYVDIFSRIKRLGGADRKRAVHALLAMLVGSAVASALLTQITGKERDAYNPLLIMQWQVGGLATGATQNLMEFYRILTNLTFAQDEGQKKFYFDELAILIPQLGDSFIPFYSVTMNLLESLADSKYIDRKWLRQIREVVDENYELNEEFYQVERDWLEKVQHGLFGTNTPSPSDLETSLKRLEGIEDMLGGVNTESFEKARQKAVEEGREFQYTEEDYIYTTSNLGSDINSAIYGLDPSEITEENGFSKIVMEYLEYQDLFEDYKDSPADKRYEYREENPETDAALFFWSYVTTIQSDTAKQLVLNMVERFNVSTSAIKGYAKAFEGEYPWQQQPTEEEKPWQGETENKYPWRTGGAGIGVLGFPTREGAELPRQPIGPEVSGRYTAPEEISTKYWGGLPGTRVNASLQSILDFLAQSKINENLYSKGKYMCGNFTADLLEEAKKVGLPIGQATIFFWDEDKPPHRIAWGYTGGEIRYIEPQSDHIFTLPALDTYWATWGGLKRIRRIAPDGTEEIEEFPDPGYMERIRKFTAK